MSWPCPVRSRSLGFPSGDAREASLRALLAEDVQSALLARLAEEGLEPLSRWRRPLGKDPGQALEGLENRALASRLAGGDIRKRDLTRRPLV